MNGARWPLAPQQEYMLANLEFRTADRGVRFRNPFLALQVTGPFDTDRFAAAVDALARHHGVLRAELDATTTASLRVLDKPYPGYFEFDTRCVDPGAALAGEEWHVFELTRAPLWRVKVIRVGPQVHLVSLSFCHLIWDGASMRAFLGLLSREYADPGSNPVPNQYLRFVEAAESERAERRLKGPPGQQDVLSAIADAVRERRIRSAAAEATETDTRRLAFIIGREGMSRNRRSASEGMTMPFYALLHAYLEAAAGIFGRSCLVAAFAASRTDLRPTDDCLGYFSDLSLCLSRGETAADRPGPAPSMRLLNPSLSWSELSAVLGDVAYPQEIYDVWARAPVFTDASSLAGILPGTQVTVLPLTPSWRMPVTSPVLRRVLAGQTIPSLVVDDLREGTGYLEFNIAVTSRRRARDLSAEFTALIRDGEVAAKSGRS
jgi:hypothetical protein